MNTITDFLYTFAAILAIVLPWFGVYAAVKLTRLSRSTDGRGVEALRERANVAVILALASLVGGALGINRLFDNFGEPVFNSGVAIVLITIIVILTSMPGLYWTIKYRRDDF